jgi:hypothetical protein
MKRSLVCMASAAASASGGDDLRMRRVRLADPGALIEQKRGAVRPGPSFTPKPLVGQTPLRLVEVSCPTTHESENQSPPEPGFARREARKRKEQRTEQTRCRLRPV